GGEQQQWQQQPVALIGPGGQPGRLATVAQLLGAVEQIQRLQVAVVEPCRAVLAAHCSGELAQPAAVQAWHQDGTVVVAQKAAVLTADRRTLGGADAEDGQSFAAAAERLAGCQAFRLAHFAGDQQQSSAPLSALIQQFQTFGQGQVGASP